AEVFAAALSWQVAEGVRSMLREWGVMLDPPVLLVDNQSALRVAHFGGSWRTRYFAVRAHRIGQEHAEGHISLRFSPTATMMADALTKLASAEVLSKLRACMDGRPPPIPGATFEIKGADECWWSLMVINRRPVQTKRRNGKKRHFAVTPGRAQQGDPAGDGPIQQQINDIYMRKLAQIWLDSGSNNIYRLEEIRARHNHHMYYFYQRVCLAHGIIPEPPIIPDGIEVKDETFKEETCKQETTENGDEEICQQEAAEDCKEEAAEKTDAASVPDVGDGQDGPWKKKRRGAGKRPAGDQRTHRRWAQLDQELNNAQQEAAPATEWL
ncbi:unnamed protein product, partial [Prorocentrum cordatum]